MFEIKLSQSKEPVPVTIMRLIGELDADGADIFAATSRQVIDDGAANVLLDLSQLSYMSSIGIRSLHNLFYALHPKGTEEHSRILKEGVLGGAYNAPHMKLLNPSASVMKVLETAGMDLYFTIFTGEAQPAIDSFGQEVHSH